MNEGVRTLLFVAVAAGAAGVAYVSQQQFEPRVAEGFANVGELFYPDFDDATAAKSIEVIEFDEERASVRRFKVDYADGQWLIPTHFGYPAEAKDRLYAIAAALVGVSREALAGRLENAHPRFGVLDPLSENIAKLKGYGQRLIIRDAEGEVLADYIIGKHPAEDSEQYYVRRPDEKQTYRVKLDLHDISTKFADWIEPDLLKLQRDDLVLVSQRQAQVELVRVPGGAMPVKSSEQSTTLTRAGTGRQWELDQLDTETQQLKSTAIGDVTGALDNLEYAGVRPKMPGLTGDLRIDRSVYPESGAERFLPDARAVLRQQPQAATQYTPESLADVMYSMSILEDQEQRLSSRGFQLVAQSPERGEEPQLELYGEGGELVVGTSEGLKYYLHFGKTFAGTQREIEVGATGTAAAEDEDVPPTQTGEPSATGKRKADTDKTEISRYLLLRVELDPALVSGKPTEPTPPVEAPPLSNDDGPAVAQQAPSEQERQAYEAALERYREDMQVFEEKLADARKKVDELNDRFADWYYLVSEESYRKLKFTRDQLVEAKSPETPTTEAPTAPPGLNLPSFGQPPG